MVFEKFSLVILSKHEQALIGDQVAGQAIPEYVDRTSNAFRLDIPDLTIFIAPE